MSAGLAIFCVACIALVVYFAGWERSKPALSQIMPTVVMGSIGAAGRLLFAAIPGAQPVTAICIISGILLGRSSGFMVGALAALVSNCFLGQGAWTPWQMIAWGLAGYFAGLLASHGAFGRGEAAGSMLGKVMLCIYGFAASYLFGFLMNTWSVISFFQPDSLEGVLLVYAAGIAHDAMHAVSTVVFLLLLYAPWSKKLNRIMAKY